MNKQITRSVLVALSTFALVGCSASTNSSVSQSVTSNSVVEESTEAKVISAEDVDTALQGVWDCNGAGTFTFSNGTLTMETQGTTLSGTYEIDTEASQITGTINASDKNLQIAIPYTYEDTLKIYNNNNQELTKQ